MVKTAKKIKQTNDAQDVAEQRVQEGFGFQKTDPEARTNMVTSVFESVAPNYDIMNDVMSLGIHRLWKAEFVRMVAPRASEAILDLAGGTGDIAFAMERARSRLAQVTKLITICDINPAMLEVGKKRAMDKGFHGKFDWVEGNAEALPFKDNQFDVVTIAFGLRNVTHLSKALKDIRRVLKPGGRFYCLEFSHIPVKPLQKLYDRYSFGFLPWAGEKIAKDRAAYQYLAESIRAFPPQDELVKLMQSAGFKDAHYRNLSMGIVAIHQGVKG